MEKDKATEQQQQPQQEAQQHQTNASTSGKSPDDIQDEFYNTGRIGRRNAMPDILDEHCETSTADLPLKLSALTTSGELLIIYVWLGVVCNVCKIAKLFSDFYTKIFSTHVITKFSPLIISYQFDITHNFIKIISRPIVIIVDLSSSS